MSAEILAGTHLDCKKRGVRFQRNYYEHLDALYGVLRKRLAIGGDGTISKAQLARDLYPDVGDDFESARRKQVSVWRWLKALEAMGLIRAEELRSRGGKSLGLRVELLPVPEMLTLQPTELQPRGG